jgi:hypothetical protein
MNVRRMSIIANVDSVTAAVLDNAMISGLSMENMRKKAARHNTYKTSSIRNTMEC